MSFDLDILPLLLNPFWDISAPGEQLSVVGK